MQHQKVFDGENNKVKKSRWLLLTLILFPLALMAEMKAVEHSIEAEKALYFFDEPTGTGRIIAFACVSCPPVSLEFFESIKVKVDGDVIDSGVIGGADLGKYSGYSATIFFVGTAKTAIRINVGEKLTTANSPPLPRRAQNEK